MSTQEVATIKPLGVSLFIVRADTKQYLLIRRSSKHLHGTWQMVTGGSHPGETATQTVLREMHEETGLRPQELYGADFVETFYDLRRDAIVFIPVFVAFIQGSEKIQLAPEEHDAFQWLDFRQAYDHLEFENQKQCITHIEKNFLQKTPSKLFRIL